MMEKESKVVGVGLIILLHVWFLSICVAAETKACRSSSCGDIQISDPFRLEGDSTGCGDPEYELACKNNRTILNGKYYVKEINYNNYTIRVVVPGIEKGNCFSTPLYSLTAYDNLYPYGSDRHNTIVLMNCTRPISGQNYIHITPCNTSTNGSSSSSQSYAYALVGNSKEVGDLPYSCTFGTTVITGKLRAVSVPSIRSMSDVQQSLLMGVELSFLRFRCSECANGLLCYPNFRDNTIQCYTLKTRKYWLKFLKDDVLVPVVSFFTRAFFRSPFTIQGLKNYLDQHLGSYDSRTVVIGAWFLQKTGGKNEV